MPPEYKALRGDVREFIADEFAAGLWGWDGGKDTELIILSDVGKLLWFCPL